MKAWKKFLFIGTPLIAVLAMAAFVILGVRQNENIKYKCSDGETILYSQVSEDDISAENGIKYVNNEILVYLDSLASEKTLKEYLDKIDAEIVGEIPQINQYQIQLKDKKSLEKIGKLVSNMEHLDWINHVSINYVLEPSEEFFPNDKEWEESWSENVGGTNWTMEAIKAPEAWEYRNKMHPVNVGVLDNVFDMQHEDLKDVFVEEPLFNFTSEKNTKDHKNHGTHVAGTIGANFNNGTGICGICPTARLYGATYNSKMVQHFSTLQELSVGFTYLIVNDCHVINASFTGLESQYGFCASRGNKFATKMIKFTAKEVEYYLETMMKAGFKFVICNASGNINEENGSYKFYKKESFNDETEFSYYSGQDYKKYQEGSADATVKQYFDKYGETKVESGNVDAKYEVLTSIENKDVNDIIITVGAVEPDKKDENGNIITYKETAYSQGGEAVDVLAPGGAIFGDENRVYSTIYDGYGYLSGTSMAAPHVSGVAAMIFALDPNIEPSRVKEIVVETSSGEYGKGEHKYGLVNAEEAVKKTLGKPTDKNDGTMDDDSWKEAYIKYLENLPDDKKSNNKFGLVFVDNNDIPELYCNEGFGYPGGDALVYYTGNHAEKFEFLSSGNLLSYIEKAGKLRDNPIEMGVCTDNIYSFENNTFTKIASGRSCGDNGPQYDQNNNLIFDYHWNNQSVDETEYERLLNEVYDTSKAVPFYDEGKIYSYSEIIEIIRNFGNESSKEIDNDSDFLFGKWEIDSNMTMDKNGVSMKHIFGTAFSDYGSTMEFQKNSRFSYSIGAGNGGEGSYLVKGDKVSYTISTYEEGSEEKNTLSIIYTDDNYPRIVMPYCDCNIYWMNTSI